jgi:hypothetical protein
MTEGRRLMSRRLGAANHEPTHNSRVFLTAVVFSAGKNHQWFVYSTASSKQG